MRTWLLGTPLKVSRGSAKTRWMNMKNAWKVAVFTLLLAGLIGCRSGRSLLQPPGTTEKQRINATVFDPYADNEIAPEVVGGRPRDFQQPLSDADRSRLFRKYSTPY